MKGLRAIFNELTPIYYLPCLKTRRRTSFNVLQLIGLQFVIRATFIVLTIHDQNLLQRHPCPLPLEDFIHGEPVALSQILRVYRIHYKDDFLHGVVPIAGRQYVGDPPKRLD